MEISTTISILILFLNNGMVKGDIIEEMLIAVHQLQNNMKFVMNKVENIENTLEVDMNSLKQNINGLHEEVEKNSKSLKNIESTLPDDVNSLKQNIKVLHEEVETNSNQDKILIESLDSFKVEVRSFQKESLKNTEEIRLSLEKSLKQNENCKEGIDKIKQDIEESAENCLKTNNAYLENLDSLKEEVKSGYKSLKDEVRIVQINNTDNAEKIYQKIDSELEEISEQNLELLGCQKLYSDNEFSYYKVPVSNGTKLVEGTVSITCERVGMEAVCTGPAGCQYNSASCVITPMSSICNDPMRPLAEILCDGNFVQKCSIFDGVFNYMYNWRGSECGAVDGTSCVTGNGYTSGEMRKGRKRIYYGYCAKRI